MVERLHKVFLLFVKYIPVLIAVCYFIKIILNYFGFQSELLTHFVYLSPITALFILCASFVFKFCI